VRVLTVLKSEATDHVWALTASPFDRIPLELYATKADAKRARRKGRTWRRPGIVRVPVWTTTVISEEILGESFGGESSGVA